MYKIFFNKLVLLVLFFIFSIILNSEINSFAQTEPDQLLLKDYRPKNIYNIPVSIITKGKFPIIDMHSHPYANTQDEIDLWIKNMDEAGIIKTILLTHAHGNEFDSLIVFYSKYPERFELWCGFDYTGYDRPDYGPGAVK